ncbi:outer membrane beta-barrel protein [Chitinophaga sp. RAB17]|uniref:outer membrane beta-barrel protein n=1 Tax=Chitinophaga sp. RAB17 TaxID=3233049 RepID=UPI003F90C54E
MRISLLVIFLMLVSKVDYAQIVVKGRVVDSNKKPIAGCNICARTAGADTLWNCHITDSSGYYTFRLNATKEDLITLKATHLSAEAYVKTMPIPVNENIEDIILSPKSTYLNTVTVNAVTKSSIRKVGDLLEFIPGKSLLAPQLKAASIIRSIPEVYVQDDNISVRGNAIRYLYLHASDTSAGIPIDKAKLLRLPAKNIGRVTIQYNSSEMHVFLRSRSTPGYIIAADGSVTIGKMMFGSINPSFKLQSNHSSLQIYTEAGTDNRKPDTESSFYSKRDEVAEKFDNNARYKSEKKYAGSYALFEQSLSGTTTIGIQQELKMEHNTNSGTSTSSGTHEQINSSSFDKSRLFLITHNLYLAKSIDSGKLNIDVNGGFTSTNSTLNNTNRYSFNNTSGNQLTDQDNNSAFYFGKIEITNSKIKNRVITFRAEYNHLSNPVGTQYAYHLPGIVAIDSAFNNRIIQSQFRSYLSLNNTFRNGNILNASVEIVNYNYKNNDDNGYSPNAFNATKVLPAITYSIATKSHHYVTLFYNKTFRPPYAGSFAFASDSKDGLSDKVSNAAIMPYSPHQLGISYPVLKDLTTSLYWTHTNDKIMHYTLFDSAYNFVGDRLINLKTANEISLSASYNKSFGESIYTAINAVMQYQHWNNNGGSYPFDISFFSEVINGGVYYTNTGGWSLSSEFYFISGQKLTDVVRLRPYGQLELGFSMPVHKSISLSLNWSDVLYTNKFSLKSERNVFRSYSVNDVMNIRAGVSFNFDRKYADRKVKGKSALEDARKFIINKN